MRSAFAVAVVAGLVLTAAPVGSTSNGEVANVARTSSLTFQRDRAAIAHALKQLDLDSLSSVNALVETGLSMKNDMRIHKQLLATTAASTKTGQNGRALLLRGLTALAASGDYMMRYGRALGSSASLSVLQIDSDGYRMKSYEGEMLARRGAKLLGVSFS